MGPVRNFQVVLQSNGPPVFRAGEPVNGTVLLDIVEPLKMRNIRIRLAGGSTVHWTEQHGSGKHTYTVHYRNEEIYFNEVFPVWGQIGGEAGFHPVGQYTYPFHIILPHQLPGSFESAHGNVRYIVEATIDIPWGFDHVRRVAYTVVSIFDLNALANVRLPLTVSNSKTICCLCCESGPITGKLFLERTGFVPGEFIPFTAEIDNKSRRKIVAVTVGIAMDVLCHARTKSRTFRYTVSEVMMEGTIKKGDSVTWTGGQLHVPPLAPSDLPGCNIIQIQYNLLLTVKPSGPSLNLQCFLPIVIGTIPLQNISYKFSTTAYQSQVQALPGPVAAGAPSPDVLYSPPQASSAVNTVPKPTLAPYGLGPIDLHDSSIQNENTPGGQMFAPMYTYYSFNTIN